MDRDRWEHVETFGDPGGAGRGAMTSSAWAARGMAECTRAGARSGALATTSDHTADRRPLRTLMGASDARDHPGDSGAGTLIGAVALEGIAAGDECDLTAKGAA
jgi:hypothetical protein